MRSAANNYACGARPDQRWLQKKGGKDREGEQNHRKKRKRKSKEQEEKGTIKELSGMELTV